MAEQPQAYSFPGNEHLGDATWQMLSNAEQAAMMDNGDQPTVQVGDEHCFIVYADGAMDRLVYVVGLN